MALTWSYCVLGPAGDVVEQSDAHLAQPTASIGKVFLLCEAAERIAAGTLDPRQIVTRAPQSAVADSGLWQHLAQDRLPLADVCVLVGAVSDNWATNALIDIVGLAAVAERARLLGCTASALHDRVRNERTDGHPPQLSTGTARELADVARRIHLAAAGTTQAGVSPSAAALVERWLLTGVDLSMVAAPFGLDPLAHGDGRLLLWSKTGTDTCIRADMGVAWNARDAISYAAIATWQPEDDVGDLPFERMHALGSRLAARMW
jgi:beta-lactamase class A